MALKFEIRVDDKGNIAVEKLGKNAVATDGKMKGLGSSVSTMTATLKKFARLAAAGFGFVKLIGYVNNLMVAFGKQEEVDIRLAASMRHLGVYSQELFDHYKANAAAIQTQTTRGDEEIQVIQRKLTQYGFYGKAVDDITGAIVTFGADEDDLTGKANLVIKAITSKTNALSQYGIQVTGEAGSTERLASVVSALNDKFGGDEQAKIDGYTGKLKQVKNQIGDMQEEIGKLISPAYLKGLEVFKNYLENITWLGRKIGIFDDVDTDPLKMARVELTKLKTELIGLRENDVVFKEIQGEISRLEKMFPGLTAPKVPLAGGRIKGLGEDDDGGDGGGKEKKVDPISQFTIQGLIDFENTFHQNLIKIGEERLELQQKQDKERLNQMMAAAQMEIDIWNAKLSAAQSFFGGMSSLLYIAAKKNKDYGGAFKAFAISEAGINTGRAVAGALASPPVGPWNLLSAAGFFAAGIGQVHQIASQKFAVGAERGPVGGYGGTDTVQVAASPGEGVFTQRQQKQLFDIAMGRSRPSGSQININTVVGSREWVRDNLIPMLKAEGIRV